MSQTFQDGEVVILKSEEGQRMTVIGYTGDGKVICRWKEKTGFQREEFFEHELVKWEAPRRSIPFIVNPKPPRY